MKKILLLSMLVLGITGTSILLMKTGQDTNSSGPLAGQTTEPARKISGAKHFMHMRLANQETGDIAISDVVASRKQMEELRKKRSSIGLQWEELGPDNVGGRTRGILIDRNNPNRMFAGGVSGGLFYSDNGGNSWNQHPINATINGQNGHLGISCITQSANGEIYFGTGEFFTVYNGTNNSSAFVGTGIFKSTDNGVTFNLLPSTDVSNPNTANDEWAFVNELAAHPTNPQIIYAATRSGLKVTRDGGNSWQGINNMDGNPYPGNTNSLDVEVTSDGKVFGVIQGSVVVFSNDGDKFENLMGKNGLPANIGFSRTEVASSPSQPNVTYAMIATGQSKLQGIYKTTDYGLNWTTVALGTNTFNPLGEQGFYDMVIAVDPANPDRIFVGGQLELQSYSTTDGWNRIAYWVPNHPSNPFYIHADMHQVVFHPTNPNRMYVGTDGGMYLTENAGNLYPFFRMVNKSYNTVQFYGMDASISGLVCAGAQDNGTILIDYNGNTRMAGKEIKGGDGGYVEFSRKYPNIIFAEYINGSMERSVNGGQGFSGVFDSNIDGDADGYPDCNPLFIAPFHLWEDYTYWEDTIIDYGGGQVDTFTANMLFLGCSNACWVCPNPFSATPRWYRLPATGIVSAIHMTKDGVLYLGTHNGNIRRYRGLRTARFDDPTNWLWSNNKGILADNLGTPAGNRFINDITSNFNNSDYLAIALGGYGNPNSVYATLNGNDPNPSWSSIQGDLPPMPVFSVVVDHWNPSMLFVGTTLGVYGTNNGGQSWTLESSGLGTVPVFMLKQVALYEDDCPVLYAATHGRGMFRTTSRLEAMDATCRTVAGLTDIIRTNEKSTIADLKVYPNPMSRNGYVEFELASAEIAVLDYYSLDGKVVRSIQLGQLAPGSHKQAIDVDGLKAGYYLISLRSGNSILAQTKLMVNN